MSALFATTLVPVVVLAPLAGLVADRFESVRVLVAASLAQAASPPRSRSAATSRVILVALRAARRRHAFAQPAEFTLDPGRRRRPARDRGDRAVEAARYAGFAAGPLLAAALAAVGTRPALLVNAVSFVAIARPRG